MSIELKGRGRVEISEDSLNSILKIARKLGWVPEYERKSGEETGLGYPIDDIPEHCARALAKTLYRAIHAIEADCLSEPLVALVKTAGVGNMRAVADLAYAGTFYID
jgi:hypothetical protein